MSKNFDDFINNINITGIAHEAYNDVSDSLNEYTEEAKISIISGNVALELLKRYHNWLNN